MNMLVLDFETYFDRSYSLDRLSTPEYVHDARFHVHGLAIKWPDGRVEFRPDVDVALTELREVYGQQLERVTVAGHNLYFDAYILSKRYGLRPCFLVDTMLLAQH